MEEEEEEEVRPLPSGRPLRLLRTRLGMERSMTVSLDEMLEEEDMLSRWLPGSALLHSRSFMVASVHTSGTHERPSEITAASTCPSLFDRRTGGWDGSGVNRALLTGVFGAAGAPPGGPVGAAPGSVFGACLGSGVQAEAVGVKVLMATQGS